MQGTVIFLNGISSAGKSSLAHNIMNLDPTFTLMDIDSFMMPEVNAAIQKFNVKADNSRQGWWDDLQAILTVRYTSEYVYKPCRSKCTFN